ncbi:MAG: hypothetical protein HC853_04965 [Anaerolineae bacterium]|nr:hypothetical protein [Anaerolineae bacterium]
MSAWQNTLPRSASLPVGENVNHINRETIQKSLSELVVESLRALLPVTALLVWLWCVVVILTTERAVPTAYIVFAINLLSGALSFRFHERHLSMAVAVYLAGLLGTVTLIAFTFPSPTTLCLFVLAILPTAMLTNARALAWVTGLCAACVVGLSAITSVGWMQAGTALLLVLLSALTAWLARAACSRPCSGR